jgi:hypothetical protein
MRRRRSRNGGINLLTRPPSTERATDWSAWVVDPAAQLEELADLRTRGLLTQEEFEDQKARVLGS